MAHHVLRKNALCRAVVMRAARGVNMMIAGIPAQLRRIYPSLQMKGKRLRLAGLDFDLTDLNQVLRPSSEFDGEIARRQFDLLAVGSIDLRMKCKVGGKPFCRRRIKAALSVADYERGCGGLSSLIENA